MSHRLPSSAQSATPPGQNRLRVQVILEESSDRQHLLSDLPHWLPIQNTELFFTPAVHPVSDTRWFFNEERVYLESIVEKQRLVTEDNHEAERLLTEAGFMVQQDALTVSSDEGCRRVLEDLHNQPRDLIVIGSGWPASGFSLNLARHAHCSVLLLRTPLKSRIGRLVVLLTTDGSTAAATAARKLPSLIQPAHLNTTIVNVQTPEYMENAVFAPFVNIPGLEEALAENARMLLDINRIQLEEQGVQVLDTISLNGDPAYEILQLAREKIDPDLIVMGAHNRSALSNWLLGSVSQRLVHDAPYNLLLVR